MMFPATETSVLIAGHLRLPFYIMVLQPSAVAVLKLTDGLEPIVSPHRMSLCCLFCFR